MAVGIQNDYGFWYVSWIKYIHGFNPCYSGGIRSW